MIDLHIHMNQWQSLHKFYVWAPQYLIQLIALGYDSTPEAEEMPERFVLLFYFV